MGPLAAMLSGIVMSDIGVIIARLKRNSALWAMVMVFLLTAYIFGMTAAAIYLSSLYTPLQATLILAGSFLAVGILLIAVMAMMNARDRRLAAEKRRNSKTQTSLAVATALTIFRKRPLAAAGAAVAVGTVLGLMRKSGRKRQ
ncbi:hypothetical protein [Pararhizobium gei]|uniref:hypothetical protein n=1 Tax=Pararhizobium gei TaxID=1395951 RepID=UPI0023DC766F|nr:hypothetical protein [Rhizobium gei]